MTSEFNALHAKQQDFVQFGEGVPDMVKTLEAKIDSVNTSIEGMAGWSAVRDAQF